MTFLIGLALLIVDAAVVAWPLYATWPFLLVTAGAGVLAWAVATISQRRRFAWYVRVIVAVLAGLLIGALLTHADRLTSIGAIADAYAGMLRGLIAGWKELLTVPLPAGSYVDVLVPWFIVVYAGVLLALSLRRTAWLSAGVGTLPLLFALAFSSPSVGAVALPGVAVEYVQIVLGIVWMLGAFLVARGAATSAPVGGPAGTGRVQRPSRRSPMSLGRRLVSSVSAVAVLAIAIGVVAAAVVATGIPGTRVALRQDIEPAQTLAVAPSPLSLYRESFVNSQLFAGTALTYSATPGGDGRIRIAVLPFYDGNVFSASPDGDSAPGFQRLPVPLPVGGETETITVTLGDAFATGPWLPVTSGLSSVRLGAPSNDDGNLYVNRETQSAVVIARDPQTALVGPALSYDVVRGTGDANPTLEEIQRPTTTGSLIAPELIPPAMTEWMRLQAVPVDDGAGLAELVDRLRARGYLSHALTAPTDANSWMTALAGADYAFQPSLAGHSLGRLDQLFTQLVDKQRGSSVGAPDERLVAGVGDDEQFAAAVALMAMANGFPARVVTGYVDCENLTCTGADLRAWVEVQGAGADGATGGWATVDVDPQYENPIAPRTDVVQEPQIGTSVTNESATVLPPGEINPQAGDSPAEPVTPPLTFDWVLPLLRTIGLVALAGAAVMSPFLAILAVKARRRRVRRRDGNPRDRVVGAWEEYLDNALDFGLVVSPSLTRREVAQVLGAGHALGSANVLPLADGVDTAVFGTAVATDRDVDEFWSLVESAKLEMERGSSWWRILMARLSLASFLRYRANKILPTDSAGFVTLASVETEKPTGIGGFTRYITRSTRRRRGE
jgi:hypothetical protein